ncbi:hypothetical protein E1B28_002429 [Marasmius oreades]|uniref:Uncharacterized protein n=1 Tax=Marasmius oreades TaxID=181124 RepID=A0A9P7ULD9_9AGAR|nr:uncharacterized protein E1B28_002429 [Marasmius oreades]KAG7086478.1 hypothetical protein E1B28_002429 [Marasmius oreades]
MSFQIGERQHSLGGVDSQSVGFLNVETRSWKSEDSREQEGCGRIVASRRWALRGAVAWRRPLSLSPYHLEPPTGIESNAPEFRLGTSTMSTGYRAPLVCIEFQFQESLKSRRFSHQKLSVTTYLQLEESTHCWFQLNTLFELGSNLEVWW